DAASPPTRRVPPVVSVAPATPTSPTWTKGPRIPSSLARSGDRLRATPTNPKTARPVPRRRRPRADPRTVAGGRRQRCAGRWVSAGAGAGAKRGRMRRQRHVRWVATVRNWEDGYPAQEPATHACLRGAWKSTCRTRNDSASSGRGGARARARGEKRELGREPRAALGERGRLRLAWCIGVDGRGEERVHPVLRAGAPRARGEVDEERGVERPRREVQRDLSPQLDRQLERATRPRRGETHLLGTVRSAP